MEIARNFSFFIIIFISGCQTFHPPTLENVRIIQVTVINVEAGKPIEGLKVSVSKNYLHRPYWPSRSTVLLAEYTTDKQGNVFAPLSLKGSYTFRVFGEVNSKEYDEREYFDPTKNRGNKIVIPVSSW